ncbi:LacI family DNA-binding transcriptional regulator [Streptomyces sp. LHD-70]|uniref:LacI family DNA-binding transcriptional regulator n=1 Tax=Streptomyces sp. LHD-70 TaxID=3072140 RepID=UPI00281084D8|nr:LacI family DNA-binding transcriptional regulator [Streptomyces sp. LHD-70]MDQ8708318.1 LacI family DNA-binding transcriptional regulator [Streptomyces sp. LHD-70]
MADVTLKDVARVSGCSVATVSRVLAGTRPVGAEVAHRVRAAAESLGYRPNQVARALRNRSTGTIGLVLPQITNPFFPVLVREVEHALHAGGRALLLADCDDDPATEANRITALLDRQVDALLVIPVDETHSRDAVALAESRVPLVMLDRVCGPGIADAVAVDNAAGVGLVLDHLAGTGRRRFCFLGAAGTASTAVERRMAYEAGVAALDPQAPGRTELGDFSLEWGRAAAERIWPARPDAVICGNDLIAVGAVQRLRQLGADVPGDVAVTGFDDIPMASLAEPNLTTVRQPAAAVAAEALRLLDQRLAGRTTEAHQFVRLAPELVVRASSIRRATPPGTSPSGTAEAHLNLPLDRGHLETGT